MMKKVMTGAVSLVAAGLMSSGVALAAQGYSNAAPAGDLSARVAAMEKTLEVISKHENRPTQASEMWNKHIRLSGGIAVDYKVAGSLGNESAEDQAAASTPSAFTGVNVKRFGINDAFLNVDAMVNDWVSARVGLSYTAVTENYEFSHNFGTNRNFNLDQAYVTMSNFEKSPFYFRAGQQYFDFGHYDLHPIAKSFTQVLTEVNDIGLQVGFIDNTGFNGSVFVTELPYQKREDDGMVHRHRKGLGYGGSVSYGIKDVNDSFDVHGKLGYLSNITMLDAYVRNANDGNSGHNGSYEDTVRAVSANLGIVSGPFDVNAAYAGAMNKFSNNDVEQRVGKGGRPNAFELNAGYKFNYYDHDHKVVLGYATSSEASSMGLPKDRYYVDYNVEVYKNTNFTLEYAHDKDYGTSDLGTDGESRTGKNFNVVTARLAVNFG